MNTKAIASSYKQTSRNYMADEVILRKLVDQAVLVDW